MAEYIEKEAALKAVCDACGIVPDIEKENCQYKFVGCEEYYNVFDLPPADVRPVVHGHWTVRKSVISGEDYIACSECLQEGRPGDRFCSCCGAEMGGETNG